ncbi:MAG TPA: DoxX family protein [Cytophagaceae bacterium]|jgi:uncharacterized membrane protein YphA (DoxX/SURF4 family)|nr:DoxX family protein [Cytophagaceae bacterium]
MKNLYNSYSFKDWIVACLRISLGVMFIFSGFVKLIPIEPFELKFIELGIANWIVAPFMARLIIAVELFLGLMLILNIKPRATVRATIIVLVFFTFYLLYDILKNGNDGNCGCFGTIIVMTPVESIVKNLLMIPLVLILMLMNTKELNFKIPILISLLAIVSIAAPFILYPLDDLEDREAINSEKIDYPFPVNTLQDFNSKGSKIDFRKGEFILAFMSVECLHCKNAAYKLYIINKQKKLPPIYMILLGTEEEVPNFVSETKADFPYYLFNKTDFFQIAGNSVPRIFYIKSGIVKAKFDSNSLTETSLSEALQKR